MYGKQTIGDDDIQQLLAGLRRGRDELARIRRQTPIDSLFGAQADYVMKAIDGMAETITGDREYFRE
jgi:hypothetical protein